MNKEQMSEAIARALCGVAELDPDVEDLPDTPTWVGYIPEAQAALSVVMPWIEALENRRVIIETQVMRAVASETIACQKRVFAALKPALAALSNTEGNG